MVAGLGDRRSLLRSPLEASAGRHGYDAALHGQYEHENVTVRRQTLTLIADQRALPYLLGALLNDVDPVVEGSAVGAMAVIGAEAVTGLLDILVDPDNSPMQTGLASWGFPSWEPKRLKH